MQQRDDLLVDLPPDARSALLGLIGSTFAELKQVDANIISRNANVTAMKSDLNRLVQEANSLGMVHAPINPHEPPQVIPHQQAVPQIVPQEIPIAQLPITSQPAQLSDPNQLEFDFYRKITPDDINNKFAEINLKLSNIVEKLEELLTIVTNGLKDRE
jgi:hypothetical protein